MTIRYHDLPSPKGLPLLGQLHQVRLPQLHAWFESQAAVYGDIFRVRLGPTRLTVISSPELIRTILKSRPDDFRRVSKLDNVMQEEGIHGVFNAEGESWKRHRRLVTRGLDIKHLQAFYPTIMQITERLRQKFGESADGLRPSMVQDDLLRYTVDVTTSLAFGMDMNTLQQPGNVIQDQMEKIFPMIFRRINSPIPWYKIITTRKDKAFRSAMDNIDGYIRDIIKTGEQRLDRHPELREQPANILDAFLSASDEETMTEKEIKSNLLTLLMAGEDTTAHSLAWAIYLIGCHPEIQARLQQEADEILGSASVLTGYQDQDRLRYTTAVIQETLRLKSVAPVMLVEPVKEIDLDQYRFEKGSRIVLLTRYAGLQDRYFSNASAMDPDRWLEDTHRKCPVHQIGALMPFGFGPRLCPGKNLAMLEMKLVLSMMAKHFHLHLHTSPEQVKENMAFTMMPGRYDVRLSRRT